MLAFNECSHGRLDITDHEIDYAAGGPYLKMWVDCMDCGGSGEFSDHIYNVLQLHLILWAVEE
jgi:hypothetical protein